MRGHHQRLGKQVKTPDAEKGFRFQIILATDVEARGKLLFGSRSHRAWMEWWVETIMAYVSIGPGIAISFIR